jgi:hypothetical protein
VLSDFGPEAFTVTSTGGGNQQLMFPGNVTAQLQAGTYYLGVFGQGTAGDECSFTVLAKASNRTVLPPTRRQLCVCRVCVCVCGALNLA